jgi:predicted RNA binding protein YcfA (HicA-like mRNA interferase family)
MPVVDTHQPSILRRLVQDGWICEHGGNHDKYRHTLRSGTIIVPRHKSLSPGVARSIAKAAGWI